jgi:hypothetical protein
MIWSSSLPDQIAATVGQLADDIGFRSAVVTQVSSDGTVSLNISGVLNQGPIQTDITRVSCLSSCLPAIGDVVFCAKQGAKWVALGTFTQLAGQWKIKKPDGTAVAELGLLDDGTYGIAMRNGNQLVDLSTIVFGPGTATVSTGESTSSTSYTNLATVGPSLTATIGSSGRAKVTISATIIGAAPNTAAMATDVSGASTIGASDAKCLLAQAPGSTPFTFSSSRVVLYTGLNAGSTTFTAKYRVSAGSATFINRDIIVEPY